MKRTIIIDAQGNFLAITCGRANRHDQTFAVKTIDKVMVGRRVRRPKRLGGDKGYDSNPLRNEARKRHIVPCLIRRTNNRTAVTAAEVKQSRYCQQRWKVERSFNWLNNNRRVDRFMEKRTKTYQGFCYMAFIKFYLKKLAK